jgi:hypothetical protein
MKFWFRKIAPKPKRSLQNQNFIHPSTVAQTKSVSRIQHRQIHSFIHRNVIDPIIHSSLCGWETIRSDQWGGCPSSTLSSKKHLFIYFIIIESKFPLDDEDEENLAHFYPLLILQSVCEITTETTSTHLRSCFSRHFFCGFVRGFAQKYIWLRLDLCLLTFFFCRFVPGFDRNIWHQIMRFLFARKFLLRIVRYFEDFWQKYMASMRSCLLDISSADSFEDFT